MPPFTYNKDFEIKIGNILERAVENAADKEYLCNTLDQLLNAEKELIEMFWVYNVNGTNGFVEDVNNEFKNMRAIIQEQYTKVKEVLRLLGVRRHNETNGSSGKEVQFGDNCFWKQHNELIQPPANCTTETGQSLNENVHYTLTTSQAHYVPLTNSKSNGNVVKNDETLPENISGSNDLDEFLKLNMECELREQDLTGTDEENEPHWLLSKKGSESPHSIHSAIPKNIGNISTGRSKRKPKNPNKTTGMRKKLVKQMDNNRKVRTVSNASLSASSTQAITVGTERVNRSNIEYSLQIKTRNAITAIGEIIAEQRNNFKTIIFCASAKECDKLFAQLKAKGIVCGVYGSSQTKKTQQEQLNDWMNSKFKVLCATNTYNAYETDNNIGTVIHYNMPASMALYWKQSYLAGINGTAARSILFYSFADAERYMKMFYYSNLGNNAIAEKLAQLRDVIKYCENVLICRRLMHMQIYSNDANFTNRCEVVGSAKCDVCARKNIMHKLIDVRQYLQNILSLVNAVSKITVIGTANILKGRKKVVKDSEVPLIGNASGMLNSWAIDDIKRLVTLAFHLNLLVPKFVSNYFSGIIYIKVNKRVDLNNVADALLQFALHSDITNAVEVDAAATVNGADNDSLMEDIDVDELIAIADRQYEESLLPGTRYAPITAVANWNKKQEAGKRRKENMTSDFVDSTNSDEYDSDFEPRSLYYSRINMGGKGS